MMQTWKTREPFIACVDVDYRDRGAFAAGLWFRGWSANQSEREEVAFIPAVAEYEPGAFYKRELPCLMAVLSQGPLADIVLIDGYVWLGDNKPGLGAHLFEALGRQVAVVGIAKTKFASANAMSILRGESKNALAITAAGIGPAEAAKGVVAMHGDHRLPTLLKAVDQKARTANNG
jgi:deoxyribonuclease V